jgi:hypothetical protein
MRRALNKDSRAVIARTLRNADEEGRGESMYEEDGTQIREDGEENRRRRPFDKLRTGCGRLKESRI